LHQWHNLPRNALREKRFGQLQNLTLGRLWADGWLGSKQCNASTKKLAWAYWFAADNNLGAARLCMVDLLANCIE